MKAKAVIIISGGLDSATLLYKIANDSYDVSALSFDYDQRHKKELIYAQKLCTDLKVNHKIVDIRSVNDLVQGSALTTEAVEVPEGHYSDASMKSTVVPNRNAIMLSLAYGYAVSIDAEIVAFAAHAGDHPIYPDCRPSFVAAFDAMEKIANDGFANPKLKLEAPFININKAEIVRIGSKLSVPYEDTWSCYKGGKKHCGKCGTCVERKEAFKLAGVLDPTEYEK